MKIVKLKKSITNENVSLWAQQPRGGDSVQLVNPRTEGSNSSNLTKEGK